MQASRNASNVLVAAGRASCGQCRLYPGDTQASHPCFSRAPTADRLQKHVSRTRAGLQRWQSPVRSPAAFSSGEIPVPAVSWHALHVRQAHGPNVPNERLAPAAASAATESRGWRHTQHASRCSSFQVRWTVRTLLHGQYSIQQCLACCGRCSDCAQHPHFVANVPSQLARFLLLDKHWFAWRRQERRLETALPATGHRPHQSMTMTCSPLARAAAAPEHHACQPASTVRSTFWMRARMRRRPLRYGAVAPVHHSWSRACSMCLPYLEAHQDLRSLTKHRCCAAVRTQRDLIFVL